MRVLLVEDEKLLAEELVLYLGKEQMVCDWASTYAEASESLAVNQYDFIFLDLGLPDGDGLDLLAESKTYQKHALVIILTARADVDDRVRGLEMGADDYLSKPFSFLELKARMQAILRRKSGWNKEEIKIGGFVLDLDSWMVAFQGEKILLTKKEFSLLHFLLIHPNRVINRFQLAEHIWGDHMEDDYQSNYIDVHIKNIRKKLGSYASVKWLETVRGVGYKIKT
ncbi:response regulator transcription factor [Cyclobacterium sp.]|uniref:response regulator transcription factor n=1 Tax=Cyclobacterium sp. TaxID=1966343 RepID=UPI0019A392F9|nr:response regulator transcription factor [Cyclobacterium sp.]MBD3630664.1 response regulator transcription factor [Cyclobacterium sp.]